MSMHLNMSHFSFKTSTCRDVLEQTMAYGPRGATVYNGGVTPKPKRDATASNFSCHAGGTTIHYYGVNSKPRELQHAQLVDKSPFGDL